MITNPYSGRQIPGTGVLDLSVEKKPIKEDQPSPASTTVVVPNGKPAGKSIQWTTELTNIFLRFMPEAHRNLKRDKDKHNKGKVWSELFDKFKETIITEKMADERFLDMVASEHLQNKWKDLKKRYNLISNSGRSSVDWPFYEQLQNILKDENSNNTDSDNKTDDSTNNEKPEIPPAPASKVTIKEIIEPEDPCISRLKRVASEFMDDLKATLEEDRKLRRIELQNEGKRRQTETCLLMSSILDEMQRSSDNSFRLMRSFIQASLAEGTPAYCNNKTQQQQQQHHHQHQQQPSSSPSSSPPPPPPPQSYHNQKQQQQYFHQYQPPKRHFH